MKTYSDHTTTPLAFHKFNCYVLLPLTGIGFLLTFIDSIQKITISSDYYFLSIYNFIFLILTLISMSAITKWTKTIWLAMMGLYAGRPLINIPLLIIFGVGSLETYNIILGITMIGLNILISIYYLKRKELFYSPTEEHIATNQEVHKKNEIISKKNNNSNSTSELVNSLTNKNIILDNENNPYNQSDYFDEYNGEDKADKNTEDIPVEETISFRLFKRIQFMAEGFCDNSIIFPYGATLKDKEVSYTYVYFLYSTANIQHNYFDRQVFRDALTYIIYTFKTIYDYTDEMLDSMYSFQHEKSKSFVTIHDECISIEESNLFEYTERVITEFPNASFEDTALANASFAEFFSYALDDIRAFKEENSSDDTQTKKEQTSQNYDSDNTKSKKFFRKENTPLILCIIALLGSLAGNIYQSSLNQSLTQSLVNSKVVYTELNRDYEDAIKYRDYYKAELFKLKNETWGFNFYVD